MYGQYEEQRQILMITLTQQIYSQEFFSVGGQPIDAFSTTEAFSSNYYDEEDVNCIAVQITSKFAIVESIETNQPSSICLLYYILTFTLYSIHKSTHMPERNSGSEVCFSHEVICVSQKSCR
jgi:hypothetical protein